MAGRFPGAANLEEFWRNLRDGVESVSFFSDDELLAAGISPDILRRRNYVKARAVLEKIELFDAAFFGFSPREAEILDPQQRIFVECAWEALESAGYDSERYEGRIGVYAGVSMSTYFLFNLYSNLELLETVGSLQAMTGNDKDFLPTRVSYLLDLKGPSVTVQTACSTSLVAVHMACQSLLFGECDMALAGGVSIGAAQKSGYFYQAGGIMSPDGHCRAFDARARGTVGGSGVGILLLKRLEDALADGDHIRAVIKGSAINNDGALKVGFTAPGVSGQAEVITEAIALSRIEAETISYVETHGTATALGDPIEIKALTQAFRMATEAKNFCALGSVKTNIGHTDAAAGVAGLIKTVLALEHRQLPPSLHFERPNPEIDFANSPFYVNQRLSEWKADGQPRRAGVSSFGMGGTNAHVIVEEAARVEPSEPAKPWQLLLLSAKTDSALKAATSNLLDYLTEHPEVNIADVAYTLQVGRRAFNHRRILVCRSAEDAATELRTTGATRISTYLKEMEKPPVVFMFSGQGAQYVGMAAELYELEPAFRKQIDRCSELLKPVLGIDLRDVLYPSKDELEKAAEQLTQTFITQPALFVLEYALSELWMACGVHPQAMIGHSIGEYVAACLAGVFSLEDALTIVSNRGRLVQQLPHGSMLSVPLSENDLQVFLRNDKRLSLAAVNADSLCVVSGPTNAITELERELAGRDVRSRRLQTSHAFHSSMMEPLMEEFAQQMRKINLRPPQIPFISNVTGVWIKAEDAVAPEYWARHLRQTVRFADGAAELLKEYGQIMLEVGPGQTLTTLIRQVHPNKADKQATLSSVRHPHEQRSDYEFFLNTVGQLWMRGATVDWSSLAAGRRRRLPLPTYPFERRRYWIEPLRRAPATDAAPNFAVRAESNPRHSSVASSHSSLDERVTDHTAPPQTALSENAVGHGNETERRIAEIWQDLLGVEQVGLYDDFFELGGHSMLGLQLISKLQETFSIEIPIQSLFEARTVSKLASVVDESSTTDDRKTVRPSHSQTPLVAIQPAGTLRPFFCVHAIGGNIFSYIELSHQLGSDQPFYGLQSLGLNGEHQPHTRIENMATAYIEAIRSVQPQGPYRLGGWSMGGVIAYEMASQLREQSEEVSLLALIDSGVPALALRQFGDEQNDAQLLCGFLINIGEIFGKEIAVSPGDLQELSPQAQSKYLLEQAEQAGLLSRLGGARQFQSYLEVFKANVKALFDYTPPKSSERIVLFRADGGENNGHHNGGLGWSELTSKLVETYSMPGNHYSILFMPHVHVLAERLRACLDET